MGPVVHLIDGHIYVFRAYHALPSMSSPSGVPTHAAYGFANTLVKFLSNPEVTHVAICFDAAMTSFRNEIEPSYKATRGETPEDLEPQFELCKRLALGLGLRVFEAEGFEADDLIATLAGRLVGWGAQVVVVSSDKDLAQLVREDGRVVLHDLAKHTTLDADGVRAKFGVDPAQIPDYLGLVGDAIDNLAGVPGVGPKSAAAVLKAFGEIERVPEDPAGWQGVRVRGASHLAGRIAEHRERALRTKSLARLRRDAPAEVAGVAELATAAIQSDALGSLFAELGWKGIGERVRRLDGPS
ncbi:MAG: 5'-3' exonuclease H3TH domain-containing protein [Myxococcota bacterium]